ncbi:uncharacterized protein BDR25DRAFT_347694 [Lindgomyces ingoldianus]|uniref:Uncharacterized protein n=1 Tax=Lindgomyces ingoldianus TaxID=673940 RepID=A0ACB6Q701_9PLEO|nr:uncharacterized protein BDR25DRAFT_347694 [Lindgomyces ingoldianus]KAF2462557.1 hypothetical protein BDR25DRAFT_347694 [Lindgomyces ingoldianus]
MHGLTEQLSTLQHRLMTTAMRATSMHEKLITSKNCLGGLECLILEGVFEFNDSNLRRAWLAFRKAMVFAQLMKIDQPNPPKFQVLDPASKLVPMYLWFRIVYTDSYLSLMLGLPHGGQETNMEQKVPGETPACRLRRAHTLIARRVLDRNRRSAACDFSETRKLPDQFWTPPDFPNLQPNTREALWETMRVADHLHHYSLVHLLHLPYLLNSQTEGRDLTCSKVTCVNASREILIPVVAFRTFKRNIVSVYCRTADFCALMAGITILLAHIDGHKLEEEDWRAHQRLGDRALVEQLLQSYDSVQDCMNDGLTQQSAEQLRRLLKIESDAARGKEESARDTVSNIQRNCGELQLSIPYFGIINIGRMGVTRSRQQDIQPSHTRTSGTPYPTATTDSGDPLLGSNEHPS